MKHAIFVALISLLVGVFYVAPPLAIKKNFEQAGDRFVLAQYKTYRDSLQAYLPRAREIYDGHFPPSEIYGGKQVPTIQNFLPSTLLAVFVFLFEGNIDAAYLGAQFFFSAIIFCLFYFFGWTLSKSRMKALFLGVLGTLTPIAVKLPFYKWHGFAEFQAFFINNFIPFAKTQFDQLYLARVDEPLLTYPIYLGAILTFFIFWQNPSRVKAIAAAVFSGLLFYTYFHHWVYWAVVWGGLFLYTLIFNRRDRPRLRNYLIFLGVLALVAVPYFVGYWQFKQLDTSQDFIYRAGVAFGRTIGVDRNNLADYAVYLVLAAVNYLLFWRRDRSKSIFIFGLIFAMFAVWNIQLAVGFSPVPHFFRRSISPAIFLIILFFLYDLLSRLEKARPAAKKLITVSLLTLSIFVLAKKAHNVLQIGRYLQPHLADYYKFPEEVAKSWDWINANLPKEPKIVSPSTMTSFYLAAHTSARPFLPTAFITLMSMEEIEDRYLASHKLFGVDESVLRARLAGEMLADCEGYGCFPDKGSNLNDSFGNIYGNYFPSRYGSFHQFLSGSDRVLIAEKRKEKIEELLGRYAKLKTDWKDMDSEYVYVGPMEEQIGIRNFSSDRNLSLIYQNSLVKIYRILVD